MSDELEACMPSVLNGYARFLLGKTLDASLLFVIPSEVEGPRRRKSGAASSSTGSLGFARDDRWRGRRRLLRQML